MALSLSGPYHWWYHVSYFIAWNFADWVSFLLKTGYYVTMTPHLFSILYLNLVASGCLNFQTKSLSILIYKVLLYDGKTVVWYAMCAVRIIGSITCGACLKDKVYCNNPQTDEDEHSGCSIFCFTCRNLTWNEQYVFLVWCMSV